jgi:hypothetical protein
MLRLGGTDFTETGCASVVIIGEECYSTFLLQNVEHPTSNAERRSKSAIRCSTFSVRYFISFAGPFSSVVRSPPRRQFQTSMNAHPKLSVETATQLAVFLANRPGALARVCEALANAGINIYALATSDTVDHTVVRMVVSDPTKALMLLGEAGVLALETDVLTIETASEPGVLAKIAERLAEAEVNIEYTYLAAGRDAERGLIILRPSDVETARRVLEEL